jgi:hypothetical protein
MAIDEHTGKKGYAGSPIRTALLACGGFLVVAVCASVAYARYSSAFEVSYNALPLPQIVVPTLDKAAYDKKMKLIANDPTWFATSTATTTKHLWPAAAPYPNVGALLPFNRIVAYYGNFYSKGMGVLGEYPEDQLIPKFEAEIAKWKAADPSTPVIPAIEYIDVTAQGSPGKDGKYRLRMPDSEVDKALALAHKVNGIVILDIQLGGSTFGDELPLLDAYLKLPNVHLALDPEFAMKGGAMPGTEIGTLDATQINYVAEYLANIVRENKLPPKILIVHRFTEPMVTNYKRITPLPEVQIVMDMDGWGSPERKIGTYEAFIAPEPVQFTGFKLFYKNDIKPPSTRMLTTSELLKLSPQPMFIQYQ